MLKRTPNAVLIGRWRLMWYEKVLVAAAIGLGSGALLQFVETPATALALLVASITIGALLYERMSTRHSLLELARRFENATQLDKLEVEAATGATAIDQALNRMIQRVRHQEQAVKPVSAPQVASVREQLTVAVLSVGLRQGVHARYSSAHVDRMIAVVQAALDACRQVPVFLQVQGDGTLLLVFGAFDHQTRAASMAQAIDIVLMLAAEPDLRFGLSYGHCALCVLPGGEHAVIGAPLEDAARLYRMAASWHEYTLLCAEPTAMLMPTFTSQRTSLTLTHPAMPPLPVYNVEIRAQAIALGA